MSFAAGTERTRFSVHADFFEMTCCQYDYRLEQPDDIDAIEILHAHAFGPGRFTRTAFRMREGVSHDPALSFVATALGRLVGSVRLTGIRIGDAPALLLGPLAVEPDYKKRSIGKTLVARSLAAATDNGHRLVMLVGDHPYYGPLGFDRVPFGKIQLPGPVDPARLLLAELVPGAAQSATGMAGSAVPAQEPDVTSASVSKVATGRVPVSTG